jgi:cyclopropane fatty-acyl-phospholipid synthase-like methyltransferase
MMTRQTKQALYDELYKSAIHQGGSGWGGNDRLAKGVEQIARILAHPSVPRTGNALELGCGEGNFCRLLAQQGYHVTGIDISSVAIRWAHEKNASYQTNIRYVHGDLSQSNFHLSDFFDVIVDGNCLHCILAEHRSTFLRNVHARLAEKGIFFISSLCSQDTKTHIMLRDGEPYRHIPTSDTLHNEVRQAGFEVLDRYRHRHTHRKYDHINLFLRKAQSSPVTALCDGDNAHDYTYDIYGF